jgi:hypothetical protein
MTHQSADYVNYQGEAYELLGGNFSQQLFDSYGLTPTPIMIGMRNYRGYIVKYSIEAEMVYLEYLHVNDLSRNYPAIRNMMPKVDRWQFGLYENLHFSLTIDGDMVVGRDLANRLPSMRLAHHYRILYQLEFEQGKLSSLTDLSVKTALLRQQMDEIKAERENIAPEQRENHRKEELRKLYGQIFNLTFGVKRPDDTKE